MCALVEERGVRRPFVGPGRRELAPLPVVASSGSAVSWGGFLQDRFVQLCLREKPFEPSILLLQLFELCGLIDF